MLRWCLHAVRSVHAAGWTGTGDRLGLANGPRHHDIPYVTEMMRLLIAMDPYQDRADRLDVIY